MLITSTNKNNIPFLGPEITGINICRDIGTCQVTDMFQSVGIRECRGNKVSLGEIVHLLFFVCAKITKCIEGFGAFFKHKT
jgi:hypothetical protein